MCLFVKGNLAFDRVILALASFGKVKMLSTLGRANMWFSYRKSFVGRRPQIHVLTFVIERSGK